MYISTFPQVIILFLFLVQFIGCIGVVNTVVCKESRDAVVWYRSDVIFNFNLDVLTKV